MPPSENYALRQHLNGGFISKKKSPNIKQSKQNYVISKRFNGGFSNKKRSPNIIQPKSIITGGFGITLMKMLDTVLKKKTDRTIHDAVSSWNRLQQINSMSRQEWVDWLGNDVMNFLAGNTESPVSLTAYMDKLNHEHISNWDVSEVTDMSWLFQGVEWKWNWDKHDLRNWDTSNVIRMTGMFENQRDFNHDFICNWNVSSVIDMDYMFRGCSIFNQPLDMWDLGNVRSMFCMFEEAPQFSSQMSIPRPDCWIEYMFGTPALHGGGGVSIDELMERMVEIGWENISQMQTGDISPSRIGSGVDELPRLLPPPGWDGLVAEQTNNRALERPKRPVGKSKNPKKNPHVLRFANNLKFFADRTKKNTNKWKGFHTVANLKDMMEEWDEKLDLEEEIEAFLHSKASAGAGTLVDVFPVRIVDNVLNEGIVSIFNDIESAKTHIGMLREKCWRSYWPSGEGRAKCNDNALGHLIDVQISPSFQSQIKDHQKRLKDAIENIEKTNTKRFKDKEKSSFMNKYYFNDKYLDAKENMSRDRSPKVTIPKGGKGGGGGAAYRHKYSSPRITKLKCGGGISTPYRHKYSSHKPETWRRVL